MRTVRGIIAILLIIFAAGEARAWVGTGHKAIALIAYQELTPTAKQRVDFLLSKHPDYPKWVEGVARQGRGRAAFLAASIWPDTIRSDRRFHDDNRARTPDIPGLPPGSQARHAGWHFINLPFSYDRTPTRSAALPNILTQLIEFQAFGKMPENMQVYLLPWLLHLVGDVHQPLHVLDRFTKSHRNGDRGGNLVMLTAGNLHSYWDSRIGTGQTDGYLNQLVLTILKRHPRPRTPDMAPEHWVQESFAMRVAVYGFSELGSNADPVRTTDTYAVNARNIALERAALAGHRLAELINFELE